MLEINCEEWHQFWGAQVQGKDGAVKGYIPQWSLRYTVST